VWVQTRREGHDAVLRVRDDGVGMSAELIPKGSTLHGKVIDVQAASKQNRVGRIVVAFNVIEHVETRSLATIQTRSIPFEATLAPKEKFRDVRVESGEQLTLTLATPLKVRLPRTQ